MHGYCDQESNRHPQSINRRFVRIFNDVMQAVNFDFVFVYRCNPANRKSTHGQCDVVSTCFKVEKIYRDPD